MDDDFRPDVHFTPRRNWMNDPNGLVHHNGLWHLFFQHNPDGDTWGNMCWGHASSSDLVHWTEHPVAIRYGDHEAIFSGSAVVDHDNTSGFGGVDDLDTPPMVAVYTSAYATGRQAQSLAYSGDGGLTWTKYAGNPVLDRGSRAFRDPKVTWWTDSGGDGHWLLVAVEAHARQVLFYRSADLRHWELLSEFGPLPEPAGFWECPDLFALPVDGDQGRRKDVLILSANEEGSPDGCATWYLAGRFDGHRFTPDDPVFRRLDHGPDCYAAVTWDNAPGGRRLLIGWMSSWAYAREVPTSPWRGAMTLPRDLALETRLGRLTLIQRPAREPASAAGLRRFEVTLNLREGDEGVDLVGADDEVTRLRYSRSTGRLTLDRTVSGQTGFHPAFAGVAGAPVTAADALRLDIIVDRCSVEVFVNDGETALTALVFPSSPLRLRRL